MRDAGVTEQQREWLDEAPSGAARLRSRLAAALRTPADTDVSYLDQLGFPGPFPYTRGIDPNEYRGRLWHMGQGSGLRAAGAVGGIAAALVLGSTAEEADLTTVGQAQQNDLEQESREPQQPAPERRR